tara:strand:+ start:460 stop:801 length:342 start_codon:yes stop_codon:yes gene_type:complete
MRHIAFVRGLSAQGPKHRQTVLEIAYGTWSIGTIGQGSVPNGIVQDKDRARFSSQRYAIGIKVGLAPFFGAVKAGVAQSLISLSRQGTRVKTRSSMRAADIFYGSVVIMGAIG